MQTVATQCRRWAVSFVFASLALTAADGCIISGDKCGPHEVEMKGVHDLCVCEPNAVIDADMLGCTPCGQDEEAVDGKCACKAGTVKQAPSNVCMPSSIGASCSAMSDCDATYPYCALPMDGAGYCTSSPCTANADCPSGWTCETDGDTHFCHKPPSGIGTACQSSDECTSFQASYCETLLYHSCVIGNCATSGQPCPNEWSCCDYSALLGSPLSVCMSSDMLMDGACPSGGTMVTP